MTSRSDKLPLSSKKTISKILISQVQPTGNKSPYFELANKYKIEVKFWPFIIIGPIDNKDFRKQKIDLTAYNAVIFTSRHAIDYFFKIVGDLKINISQEQKYFCSTEAVALYLQKFILYRKRKVFYSADGSNKSLFDVINKHKALQKFLYPCSNANDSEITSWLTAQQIDFASPVIFQVTDNDLTGIHPEEYDIIALFTPNGARSLRNYLGGTAGIKGDIAVFGKNTQKAAEELGFNVCVEIPGPSQFSTMAAAIEHCILDRRKK